MLRGDSYGCLHASGVKHAFSIECCVERDHLQHDITPICKIMSVENCYLKTDVCCACSGMDPVKCQEVL
jgi:hypothetical protein